MDNDTAWLETGDAIGGLRWRNPSTFYTRSSRLSKAMLGIGDKLVNEINGEASIVKTALKQSKRLRQRFNRSDSVAAATALIMEELKATYYPVDEEKVAEVVAEQLSPRAELKTPSLVPLKRRCNADLTKSSSAKRRRLQEQESPSSSSSSAGEGTPELNNVKTILDFSIDEEAEADSPGVLSKLQTECVKNLQELGRYHERHAENLSGLTDGEATAVGMSSAASAAPYLTTETLSDTLFLKELSGIYPCTPHLYI